MANGAALHVSGAVIVDWCCVFFFVDVENMDEVMSAVVFAAKNDKNFFN